MSVEFQRNWGSSTDTGNGIECLLIQLLKENKSKIHLMCKRDEKLV